jgi:hypothetical protein
MTQSQTQTSDPQRIWQNRWHEPATEELLQPLKAHYRRVFENLTAEMETGGQVRIDRIYYQATWNWTIVLQLLDENGERTATLCYLVPRIENPQVSVPIPAAVLEQLPIRKLNRYVRDAIASSKCAVSIHWVSFSPTTQAEVGHITDLLRRIMPLLAETAVSAAEAEAGGEGADPAASGRSGKVKGKSGASASKSKSRKKSSEA